MKSYKIIKIEHLNILHIEKVYIDLLYLCI